MGMVTNMFLGLVFFTEILHVCPSTSLDPTDMSTYSFLSPDALVWTFTIFGSNTASATAALIVKLVHKSFVSPHVVFSDSHVASSLVQVFFVLFFLVWSHFLFVLGHGCPGDYVGSEWPVCSCLKASAVLWTSAVSGS